MPESKQDRELIELLNELRVALPGTQALFAFLLVVPFSQGFVKVTDLQRGVYFAAFLFTTVAAAFLIAPTTYHRLRWRDHDKEQILRTSNIFAIVGSASLAIAMSCVVFVITDFLYGAIAGVTTAAVTGLIVFLWFGLPLYRAAKA